MLSKSKNDMSQSDSLANTRALVTRFFQLALEKHFDQAEHLLEKLRAKMRKNEWNRGYMQALHGITLARKSGEERSLLTNLNLDDEEALKRHRREFLNHVRGDFYADYDRGFFSAWADFLKVILSAKQRAKEAH